MVYLCQENAAPTLFGIDWTAASQFATVLYTGLTALILYAAWKGVSHNNDLRSADFAYRFKKDFFTPITQELFNLFAFGEVMYVKQNDESKTPAYFKIENSPHEKQYPTEKLNRKVADKILQDEVAINLLDHFEDLSVWVDKKIISMDYVKIGYGDYITTLAEHEAIKAYLLDQSDTTDINKIYYYEGFYKLYKAVKTLPTKSNS